MVHDGKTAHQRIKNLKMLPFGEKVVWMLPKDNQRRNMLESTHQFGVFAGIVPSTVEFVILTLEGAVAVRTVHTGCLKEVGYRIHEQSQRGTVGLELKVGAGDDVNDGGIAERADARPPDPGR